MKNKTKLLITGLVTTLSPVVANAQTFGDAAAYSIFVTQGGSTGKLDAKDFSISGDVGLTQKSTAKSENVSPFTGTVFAHTTADTSDIVSSGAPSGGISSSSAINTTLNQANTDIFALASYYDSLTGNTASLGDTTFGSGIDHNTGDLTLNSTQAVNVFDFKKIKFDDDTVTLNSRVGFSDLFIIRIAEGLDSSKTLMAAGVDPSQVIWYVQKGNATANHGSPISGGYSFNGTILNPEGQATIGGEGQFNGKIYANNIKLGSKGSFVTVTPVPEPSSSALLGLGAIGFILRRKR